MPAKEGSSELSSQTSTTNDEDQLMMLETHTPTCPSAGKVEQPRRNYKITVRRIRGVSDPQESIRRKQLIDFERAGFEAAGRLEPRIPPPGPVEIHDAWLHGWDRGLARHIQQRSLLHRPGLFWEVVTKRGQQLQGGFTSSVEAGIFAEAGVEYFLLIDLRKTAQARSVEVEHVERDRILNVIGIDEDESISQCVI